MSLICGFAALAVDFFGARRLLDEQSGAQGLKLSQPPAQEGIRTPMRKVIYAINITLDGCCDHTKMTGGDEILEHFTHLIQETDLLVYGRKTYQLMVPYWPDAARDQSATKMTREFAQAFDSTPKIVFSRSLDGVKDKNSRIARGKLEDEILKLKKEQGKNILVGGVDIPSQLVQLDLVDEFHFVLQPIVAGEGRRLMEGVRLSEKLQLKLIDSKPLQSGSVALRYVKR